jgi:hypothetical protein
MKGLRCLSDVVEQLHALQIAISWEMECLAPIAGGKREKEWKLRCNEKERRSTVARLRGRRSEWGEQVKWSNLRPLSLLKSHRTRAVTAPISGHERNVSDNL